MRSAIFYTETYQQIESGILDLLNSQDRFLSAQTINSTRATGDAVERILAESFENLLGEQCAEYSDDFSRRAMGDFAFQDNAGFHYLVDVKIHRTDTKFNMPNLTSVRRLARLYENDRNYFTLIIASYQMKEERALFSSVRFVPIEFLDWSCLTIGALGWGQIQIANANHILINPHYSRKRWMLEFCEAVLTFYPREITKIGERIREFELVREYWLSQPDD